MPLPNQLAINTTYRNFLTGMCITAHQMYETGRLNYNNQKCTITILRLTFNTRPALHLLISTGF
ncbi:MAG TPA: hypothetical protein VIM79_24245, partial [Niastella sp.]